METIEQIYEYITLYLKKELRDNNINHLIVYKKDKTYFIVWNAKDVEKIENILWQKIKKKFKYLFIKIWDNAKLKLYIDWKQIIIKSKSWSILNKVSKTINNLIDNLNKK